MASTFSPQSPYRKLAHSLDALPNGFPPAADGSDLRLLARLFTPEEAALAADLLTTLETPDQVAERLGRDPQEVRLLLKVMSRKGLIAAGKTVGWPGLWHPAVCGGDLRSAGRAHRRQPGAVV